MKMKYNHFFITLLCSIWLCPTYAMEAEIATKQAKLKKLQAQETTLTKSIEKYQHATTNLYAKAKSNVLTQLFTDIYKLPLVQDETSIISAQTKILNHTKNAPVLQKNISELTKEIANLEKAVTAQSKDLVKKQLLKNIELYVTTIEKMLNPDYVTIKNENNKTSANKYQQHKANKRRMQILRGLLYTNTEIGPHIQNKFTQLSEKSVSELQKIYNKIKAFEAGLPYPEPEKNPKYRAFGIGVYNDLIYRFPKKGWIPPKGWDLPQGSKVAFYPPKNWNSKAGSPFLQGWIASK